MKSQDQIIKEQQDLIDQLQEALIWASGSSDFDRCGIAHEGWLKIRHLTTAKVEQ